MSAPAKPLRPWPYPLWIAHRGAGKLAPENTLPGFALALGIGVTTLETDIAVSRDGVLLISHDPALNPDNVLWWSLALGADSGGNATAIGASANVVVIGIAKRYGHPISFWQFTRHGLLVTVVSVALCVPYLWLRYLAY